MRLPTIQTGCLKPAGSSARFSGAIGSPTASGLIWHFTAACDASESPTKQQPQGYGADGAGFPAATELPGLNEYEAQDVIAEVAPRLAATDPSFAPLWRAWLDGRDGADRNRPFQRMFEAVMERWVEGKMQEPGLVPWQQFRERVETTLARLRATPGRGLRLVAFTSGGPIGVALQSCLGAPARAALDINWRVRNSSLTSFLYQGSRFSVDVFNETPHLASSPELVTFR